jgi:hypothetical protein
MPRNSVVGLVSCNYDDLNIYCSKHILKSFIFVLHTCFIGSISIYHGLPKTVTVYAYFSSRNIYNIPFYFPTCCSLDLSDVTVRETHLELEK